MRKTLIFDLDGTILNTIDDLTDSVNATLTHFGHPLRTKEEVTAFVGNGVPKLLERAFPEGTAESELSLAFRFMMTYYGEHSRDKTRPYDGIPELLLRLRGEGYTLAVLSNKRDPLVSPLCEYYFPATFDVAVGQREGVPRKPAPDAVFEVLCRLKSVKSDAVFIGDSDVDIETGRNAGLPAIGVTWGLRSEETLQKAGAHILAHTADELYEALKNME